MSVQQLFHADIKTIAGVGVTEYRITGDLGSVFKSIRELFQRYPALGYGTRVHSIEADYPNGDKFTARVSHSNSSD